MAEILSYKKIKTHLKVLKHSQWSLSLNAKNAYEIQTCGMNVRSSSGPLEMNAGESRIAEACVSCVGWCTQRSSKEKAITNKVGTKKWHPNLFSDFISMSWQACATHINTNDFWRNVLKLVVTEKKKHIFFSGITFGKGPLYSFKYPYIQDIKNTWGHL